MMLWDIIRDFFVQYVFGGWDSIGNEYSTSLGHFADSNGGGVESYGSTLFLPMTGYDMGETATLSSYCVGDWLSTTATIIVLVLLCIVAGMFVCWMFKWIGGCLSRLGR